MIHRTTQPGALLPLTRGRAFVCADVEQRVRVANNGGATCRRPPAEGHPTRLRLCRAVLVVGLVVCGQSRSSAESAFTHDQKWTVSAPVFKPGPEGTFDDVAVKDPSIVYYGGRYHMFYTSKHRLGEERFRTALGYVTAPTLEELNEGKRYDMQDILKMELIAPQVFYFSPQRLWYLITHVKVAGGRDLAPVYTTNPSIDNVAGWSRPQVLKTGRTRNEFWIDFWVICDEENAHLFYSNQRGAVLRIPCPIDTFPHGFAHAKEEFAIEPITGEDEVGAWRVFEAQHVYRVGKTSQFFMLVECAYLRGDDSQPYPLDSKSRFLIGLVADRLEGPWSRVETQHNEYWAAARNVYTRDGTRSHYSLVSHPEIIRSGYDQRLEIDDFRAVRMLFQTFDATGIPNNYRYDELPWKLAIMRND